MFEYIGLRRILMAKLAKLNLYDYYLLKVCCEFSRTVSSQMVRVQELTYTI